ncbi:flagellar assembly protein FliW [Biomaibacter acetigenes]|uniref:Flagellar assembly factor FliW n=1 Tax=Biomaibacter acetigenes TaxID=2316383 RepID=A0A3G2R351_9FIRM|nr:flagellar assembly protein FliW [Biomaibacter acetigenes]AYO29924.1 flagellar assembly protein FliW [Biomaibacter acetigenes]
MLINSKRFGQLDIDETKIITFINGLLGFEHLKKYIILDHPGSDFLKWLQSIDDLDISLPVVDPTAFFPDYSPRISRDDLDTIGIKNIEDAIVLCIITVPSDIQKATINLKAPVILNPACRLADQMIAENSEYKVKHPLTLNEKPEGRCAGC